MEKAPDSRSSHLQRLEMRGDSLAAAAPVAPMSGSKLYLQLQMVPQAEQTQAGEGGGKVLAPFTTEKDGNHKQGSRRQLCKRS